MKVREQLLRADFLLPPGGAQGQNSADRPVRKHPYLLSHLAVCFFLVIPSHTCRSGLSKPQAAASPHHITYRFIFLEGGGPCDA